ncbi:Arylsulfatase precursor [Aquisphaera giovannonii]|uniref:Arylsulfatase n=1 Tax=Aquisphaera giovannonii TaxID=406548 RepID=A0A5B9W3R9_9BACT|nr:arylsulfatase [Aquisphaera giovannonii]QEH34829.1 Arylsulfatase precursor [Aquisphaera giovannonii]
MIGFLLPPMASFAGGGGAIGASEPVASKRPNIVYILADDLGYGDVRCCEPGNRIATPNVDRLAGEGMRFTDAHSGSSVCTPTRYGVLTGRYAWRTRLASGVLDGYSPPLIAPGRLTVPGLLRQAGYHTAAVGKWHLGLDWAGKDGAEGPARAGWEIDYARPFASGPTSRGFDAYFGVVASLDMPPYVFLEGDRAAAAPTVEKEWIRKGPAAADFEAIDVLPALADRAVKIIGERAAAARAGRPFFLYLALTSPHTPIVPAAAWKGRSGLTPYGDFVMQTDDVVGRVLDALARARIDGETLVVFTSDNGCSPAAGFDDLVRRGHRPSGPYRGYKADIYEGGHRIPFVVRWPGVVSPGTSSDQTVCLTDLLATVADIIGRPVPRDAGEDSVSLLPILRGEARGPVREATVHHSINGSFAIRQGPWKLALCPDSGGWSDPRPDRKDARDLPAVQLFNLADDPAEARNRQAEHPEIVARLTALLQKYVGDGRSTPGPVRPNDRRVSIRRQVKAPAGS